MKRSAPLRLAPTSERSRFHFNVRKLLRTSAWFAVGAILTVLVYQVPAAHTVDVGWNDGFYVQGFADAANRWGVTTDDTGAERSYRWSQPASALIFPQIGLPARATLNWRAWRPPGSPPPRVRVLLNGTEELGVFAATGGWEQHSFEIGGGLLKPRDLFLSLVVEPPLERDGSLWGVQVDQASLTTARWPIIPYPAQALGGGLAALLAAIALHRRPRLLLVAVVAMQLLFLLSYRLQATPYPLRLLWPGLIGLWGAVAAGRYLESAALTHVERSGRSAERTWRYLPEVFALGLAAMWLVVFWWVGRSHVVLSVPGVEKDFRVFATRSEALVCPPGALLPDAHCVLRADGFYQLGYPFLLWLFRPLVDDNAFAAAQVVGLTSAVVLLYATYALGRALFGPPGGLLALLTVMLNRWTAEYTLLLGTDMPFAALWTLGLAVLVGARRSPRRALLAGALGGLAFMLRHPGLLLLPLGCAWLLWPLSANRAVTWRVDRQRLWLVAGFAGGFALASLPQLLVNLGDTGHLLYSQQAKNIWLAVYGNTDWGRWNEAANDVRLWDVIAHEPGRFVASWWGNLRAFWGTGAEDSAEFGRALALRLLSFPANLLALSGLLLWLVRGSPHERFLLVVSLLYTIGISVGFMLPRFSLPLVPIWALAATAAALAIWSHATVERSALRRVVAAAALLVMLLLAGSPSVGLRAVLEHQDPDAVAAVELIRRTLAPGERFVADLPPEDALGKYSAIAHLVVRDADPASDFKLSTTEGADDGAVVGRAGRYVLYRRSR